MRLVSRMFVSNKAFWLVSLIVASAYMGGCEGAATQADSTIQVDPAEQARIDKSRKIVDEGVRAISEKRYSEAREQLNEAKALGVESHRFEINEAFEKLDKREAKLWVNEVSEQLEQKECLAAFKTLHEQMQKLQSEIFDHEIRKLIQADASVCVKATVEGFTTSGKFADARTFVNAEATKAVLTDAAWTKVSTLLEATILEVLRGQLAEDLKEQNWLGAVEKLDASVKKGDATEAQSRQLLASIRKAAAPELASKAAKALGAKDAEEVLKQVNETIKLLRWQVMAEDVAELAKDNALPEDLMQKRGALAAWVEGQRVKMKPLKKAEKRWTHGTVAIRPATNVEGESKRDLQPSTEVWVIAQTKDMALITTADPGTKPALAVFEQVLGWVPQARLASESTADWILPNDQLKGERVWGPLREKSPTLELGIVSDVQGDDIFVKRLADDAVIKMKRNQLRNGRLAKDTKVLAFCKAANDIATIFEILPAGRVARIQCEGGMQKEEALASLRTKPELLPPSK